MRRLLDLLKEYPHYRKWFSQEPPHPAFTSDLPDPHYWLYIQREEDSGWQRAPMQTYPEAYSAAKKFLGQMYDLNITSRRRAFDPPPYPGNKTPIFWPGDHEWCGFCRRPVVYAWFEHHHVDSSPDSMYGRFLPPAHDKRCPICGIRRVVNQKWSNARIRDE